MTTPTVIRVPGAGPDSEKNVILRVVQTEPERLDLQLVGTDGEYVYVGKTRHSTVEKLQTRYFKGDLADWHIILQAKLLRREDALDNALAQDVSLDFSVTAGEKLTLAIHRVTADISQRLGEIVLKQTEDEEISLFDWTVDCATKSDAVEAKVADLQKQIAAKDEEVAGLKLSLENAQSERDDYVKQMMLKFSSVLNTKKARNRDLQRLLTKANVSIPADLAATDEEPSEPTTSGRKRKAAATVSVKAEDDVSEDVDIVSDGDMASSRASTPDVHQSEMSEDEHEDLVSSSKQQSSAATPSQSTRSGDNRAKDQSKERIPPRRDLPFARSAEKAKSHSTQEEDPDSDEETEDEL